MTNNLQKCTFYQTVSLIGLGLVSMDKKLACSAFLLIVVSYSTKSLCFDETQEYHSTPVSEGESKISCAIKSAKHSFEKFSFRDI